MLKQKKTNTIHFVSIPELDDALDEMKRQKYFNASNSKMIRDLLFLGIESLKDKKSRKTSSTKDINDVSSFNFKEARERIGFSTEAVATFANIPEETYISIENGDIQPTKKQLNILNDIFNISIE